MIAGVPGVGINGLFYLLLAAALPFRELPRTLTGRSSLARWALICNLVVMAASVTLVIVGEYWLLERVLSVMAERFSAAGHQSALMAALHAVMPRLSVVPFVALVAVILSIHGLRLVLLLVACLRAGRRGSSASSGGALLLLITCVLTPPQQASAADAPADVPAPAPLAVYPPDGYDFGSAPASILAEFDSLDEFYQLYFDAMAGTRADKAYGLALANQTLGIIRNDPAYISRARGLYDMQRGATKDAKQKALAELGVRYADSLLSDDYATSEEPKAVEPIHYVKEPAPAPGFHKIILGRSAIHVKRGALVKTQVDRVTRDWLLAKNPQRVPWGFTVEDHVPWHEGEKCRELVDLAGTNITPVWGMKATKVGQRWFAPDATGTPRFEISEDKVNNYPTTCVVDNHTAIVNDTHGISAIAWDALDADLVVGCGDHRGKMDAAYYLAEKGVNVYAPTDRFMGVLMGAKTKGTILGTAPIKKEGDGAVIGDQPITIDVNEPIVVSAAPSRYPLQYYDTPKRYFDALSDYCGKPLKITPVEVTAYGKAMNVVDAATKLKAKLLGIRVKSKEEHAAVAAWLRQDKTRRVVLFHTAVYPDGYKLFFEFPSQTSFGDIRPVFE
ncbi:MAG: hypothetical protein WCP35_02095 [Verrucomicrobiota bacterium]